MVLQIRKLCSVPVIAGNILLLALLLLSGSQGAQAQDSINYADDFVLDTFPLKEQPMVEPAEVQIDTYEEEEDDEATIGSDFMPQYNWGEDQSVGRVRSTSDSLIQQWKSQDEFWYADQSFARNKKPEKASSPKDSFFASRAFETLLIVLAVAVFVMLLVVYLGQNNAMVFRRSKTVAAKGEQDDFEKDIFSISYDKEISRAEQDGNYRMAIRLRFLHLLKTMNSSCDFHCCISESRVLLILPPD